MFKPAAKQMSRQEKVALVLNHATPEEFDRLRNVLQTATDEQLDRLVQTAQRIASKNVAELEAQTVKAKLMLAQNGVMSSEENWLILQAHLGDYFTFDQARQLIQSNAVVRQGLIWRAGVVPFGQHNQEVAKHQEAEAREQADIKAEQQAFAAKEEQAFQSFVAAAREATIRGISIAGNRANWSLVRQALPLGEMPTMESIFRVLMAGTLNFAKDNMDAVQAQARQDIYQSIRSRLVGDPHSEQIRILCNTLPIVELRNRIKLCEEIANNYSRSPWAINEEFRKHMVSVPPNHDLQARVDQIRENRRLRSLSPAELRAEAAEGRQPIQQHEYPKLPPELYDGTRIVAADANTIRSYIKKFGQPQLNEAIVRYKKLNEAWRQGE